MKQILLPLCCLVYFCAGTIIQGPSIYHSLLDEWIFAYKIASGDQISYLTGEKDQLTSLPGVVTDRNLDLTNLPETLFACPLVSYPMVLVANIPQLNGTLRVTKDLLRKMVVNDTMRYNDPDLVALNPSLASVGVFVRMFLDGENLPINQMIIDYLFTGEENRNGSWRGLNSFRHILSRDYDAVMSSISVSVNSVAFVPLPSLRDSANENLKIARIVEGGRELNPESPSSLILEKKQGGDVMVAQVGDSGNEWPLTLFVMFTIDQATCEDDITPLRFAYWVLDTPDLFERNTLKGYENLDAGTLEIVMNHLKTVSCGGKGVLEFTNISTETRSNAIFVISAVFMAIFFGLVVACWLLRNERTTLIIIVNHLVVVLGLALTMASFTLWWYSPENTGICVARFWLLGLGYTNVIAAIYIYTFSINTLLTKKTVGWDALRVKKLLLAYLLLEICEVIILILWTTVEEPRSEEVIVDALHWESIYVCTTNSRAMEIVQIAYFVLISLFGCGVIYRHWKESNIPEDSRWLLVALYNQLIVFFQQYVIIIASRSLNDEQLYTYTVPAFLFAEANVVCSFFLPRLSGKLKKMLPDAFSTTSTKTTTELKRIPSLENVSRSRSQTMEQSMSSSTIGGDDSK